MQGRAPSLQIVHRATSKCAVLSLGIELAATCEVLERFGATYGPSHKAQQRFENVAHRRTSLSTHLRGEGCSRFRVNPNRLSSRVYAYDPPNPSRAVRLVSRARARRHCTTDSHVVFGACDLGFSNTNE